MPSHEFTHSLQLPELKIIYQRRTSKLDCEFELEKTSTFEVCPKCATRSWTTYDHVWVRIKDAPIRLGSLIALVSPNGDSLAFERVYNEWGEKEFVWGDKDLEKNIPWAFAGLIQHPFFNGDVLQSETRIYIPILGLWGSADNLVKWNPSALKGLPGNWSPFLYASGDPVNFVDPSGHIAIGAGIGGISSGMAAHYSGATGWDLARSTIIGAGSGALAGTGIGGVLGSMGIGGVTNVVSQISQGRNLDTFSVGSFGISTLAGGVGASVGNFVTRNFNTLPTSVIGMNLERGLGSALETSRLQPYIGAGLGYLSSTFSLATTTANDTNVFNGEAIGGVDLMFTRKIGLNLEAKYVKALRTSTQAGT